jgi:hypothetical protein
MLWSLRLANLIFQRFFEITTCYAHFLISKQGIIRWTDLSSSFEGDAKGFPKTFRYKNYSTLPLYHVGYAIN